MKENILCKAIRWCWFAIVFSLVAGGQHLTAQTKTEILIGTHIPVTGDMTAAGHEQKWSYEQAVADVNKKGGIFLKEFGKKLPVRLVVVDDQSDPSKAGLIVEQLIKRDKVDLILSGQGGAAGVIPGMLTAEKYKTYYHGTVIWVPAFLQHNFKYATMYFFDLAQGGLMPFEVLNSIPEAQRPKNPALFLEDNQDGQMIGDAWEQIGTKFGYKIALRAKMPAGAADYSTQIFAAKKANVDAVILMATVPEAITLVRQMKQYQLNVKFFQGLKGTWANEFYDALGKDADYILCDGFWSMDYPFPGAKELGQRYYKDTKTYALGIGVYYATAQTLLQAIEKAGTLESLKVRQTVLDNEFMTVNGKVSYDKNGVALFPLADLQWWKGKRVVVYPANLSKEKVKIAPPWKERK